MANIFWAFQSLKKTRPLHQNYGPKHPLDEIWEGFGIPEWPDPFAGKKNLHPRGQRILYKIVDRHAKKMEKMIK